MNEFDMYGTCFYCRIITNQHICDECMMEIDDYLYQVLITDINPIICEYLNYEKNFPFPYFASIIGYSCTGKTTLAKRLLMAMPKYPTAVYTKHPHEWSNITDITLSYILNDTIIERLVSYQTNNIKKRIMSGLNIIIDGEFISQKLRQLACTCRHYNINIIVIYNHPPGYALNHSSYLYLFNMSKNNLRRVHAVGGKGMDFEAFCKLHKEHINKHRALVIYNN